jgi:hypothetical protein
MTLPSSLTTGTAPQWTFMGLFSLGFVQSLPGIFHTESE